MSSCTGNPELECILQKAIHMLNTADVYAPVYPRFKEEDKVASNFFAGLVLVRISSFFYFFSNLESVFKSFILIKIELNLVLFLNF